MEWGRCVHRCNPPLLTLLVGNQSIREFRSPVAHFDQDDLGAKMQICQFEFTHSIGTSHTTAEVHSNAKCQIGEDKIQAKKGHHLKSQIKTHIQTQIQRDIKDNPGS